ncbi:MAG: hypothetical protein K0M70_07850 [Arenimonas sp.]|uniref:hypothetical protein n=1 Tax=Arenimonas sp. TaxID=1872635 RepID=UPI0025BC900E|nr:hypothetical protein [Arenimonas sp.]MBW8367754.1 hypothetical protein [Arenimonas sp.]
MSEPRQAPGQAPPESEPPRPDTGPAGTISADAQAVLDAAKAAAGSYFGGFTTVRRLFAAEVSLARDALVSALLYLLVTTVMLGTAYLLLTALLVAGLRAAGAPWPLALAVPLLVSVGVAVFGILRAQKLLQYADFEATRRQLKKGFHVNSHEDAPL